MNDFSALAPDSLLSNLDALVGIRVVYRQQEHDAKTSAEASKAAIQALVSELAWCTTLATWTGTTASFEEFGRDGMLHYGKRGTPEGDISALCIDFLWEIEFLRCLTEHEEE